MGADPAARGDSLALGYGFGFLGVTAFSLTLPATRAAVVELDPVFVGLGRTVVAALIAAAVLAASRQPWPTRAQSKRLVIVALGVVLGFPLLSALAMRSLPASHGAIMLGVLPLATAVAGVVFSRERPSAAFWALAVLGSVLVVSYGVVQGAGGLAAGDFVLLGAVVAAGVGYAEGARLSLTMGGWQVISWALVFSAPLMAIPAGLAALEHGLRASPAAWLGFAYVSVVSQYLGFFPWYRGLALGGIARVGQVQLLQVFLTIFFAALLLDERIDLATVAFAVSVAACVAVGRTARITRG